MKIIDILKSKRGTAIELAIMMMLVAFGLCLVLTTVTLSANSYDKMENKEFLQRVELDQIVEEFKLHGEALSVEEYEDSYDITVNSTTLTIREKSTVRHLLTVTVEDGKITKWSSFENAD